MYALVEIKGKQYKAEKGALLRVDRIAAEEGDALEFDSVLMLSNEGDTKVGAPYVDGVKVKGKVEIQGMGKKIKIFRYKRRKNNARRMGHRQKYTFFRVEDILGHKPLIDVSIRLDGLGLLSECRSFGHADAAPAGQDIVCAAVSVLLRTCGRTLEGREGVVVSGEAAKPGELVIRVDNCAVDSREWLRGVGDSLITGLSDLVHQYPEACGLEIYYN